MEFTVNDLISGHCSDKINDKVFIYASSVKKEKNVIKINVKNENLVDFDKSIAEKTVDELRKLNSDKSDRDLIDGLKDVLISSGSFLFINNNLVLTKRTTSARVDPGKWTSPAGRCDRTPLKTALKETVEEIEIIVCCKNIETFIYPEGSENFVENRENSAFVPYESSNGLFDIKLNKIEFYLDGELKEKSELWFYYDVKTNTLEFRLPIFYSLDEKNITIRNPEYPSAETRSFHMNSLPDKESLVSAIQQLRKIPYMLNHPPHLFYLTGLSLDKKKWDKTYSDALYDDADYDNFINSSKEKIKEYLKLKFYLCVNILLYILLVLCSFYFSISDNLNLSILNKINLSIIPIILFISIQKNPLQIFLSYIQKKTQKNIERIKKDIGCTSSKYISALFHENIKEVLKISSKKADEDTFKSEMFGFYLANQGDTRGLNPLSALGSKNSSFTVSWAYSDFPYYKNIFIDVVSLTIPRSFFKKKNRKKINKELKDIYINHGLEALISRGAAIYFEEQKNIEKLSKYLEEEKEEIREKKGIVLTRKLKSRNLFGISLLSSILYYLEDNFSKSIKPSTTSPNDKNIEKNLINYLLEISGNPELNKSAVEKEEKFELKLINDQTESKRKKILKNNKIFPENHIKKMGFFKFFGCYSLELRIPIKLYFSLPIIDSNLNSDSEPIIPPAIIPNKLKNIPGEKIILSIGGTEHNRALVHLVNKYRIKMKKDRLIGFNGNAFDRKRLTNEKTFLMGLNGPVFGGHSESFYQRTVDSDGFSTGEYIELISFKIDSYRVLCVYGFSALASKLMLEYLTARAASYKKGTSLYQCLIGKDLTQKYKDHDFCALFELKTPPHEMEKRVFEILNGEDSFTFLQQTESNNEIFIKLLTYYNTNIVEKDKNKQEFR